MPLSVGNGRRPKDEANSVCIFCQQGSDDRRYGQMLTDKDETLFSSGLEQRGCNEKKDGILGFLIPDINKEVQRSKKLRCKFCKQKGTSIGCAEPKCKMNFHFACGKDNNITFIYKDDFRTYCLDHRQPQTNFSKEQKGQGQKANQEPPSTSTCQTPAGTDSSAASTCYICYCEVEPEPSYDVLLSPCCVNACYHRDCIEEMAYSAGLHFFRCPLCNNIEDWQGEMINCGIYIPDRDASWELVPNAYNSLTERKLTCNADSCICPEGREFDDYEEHSGWELVICAACGSQAIHISCSNMRRRDKQWLCTMCKEIDERLTQEKQEEEERERQLLEEREAEQQVLQEETPPRRNLRSARKRQQEATPRRPARYTRLSSASAAMTEVTSLMLNSSLN